MQVPVLNMQGQQVGSITIDEQTLGGEVNPSLIKQAYVRYHAGQRQGSSKTKNRHEVEGSTKKIYKQKGTGNARHGDRKVNIFKGGGHGHHKQKTREDFRLEMPKKMRRKANRNALLAKLVDNEVRIIDSIAFGTPKTKDFVGFLEAIKVDRSALVALSQDAAQADSARRSGRNVDHVTLCRADQLNCFEMLNHRYLVIAKGDLEAWLAGPWSQTGKDAKLDPKGSDKSEEPKADKPKAEKPKTEKTKTVKSKGAEKKA